MREHVRVASTLVQRVHLLEHARVKLYSSCVMTRVQRPSLSTYLLRGGPLNVACFPQSLVAAPAHQARRVAERRSRLVQLERATLARVVRHGLSPHGDDEL